MNNDLISRSALLEKQTYMLDEALCTSTCVLTEDIKAAPDVGVWYEFVAHTPPDFYCADGERRDDDGRNSSVQSML